MKQILVHEPGGPERMSVSEVPTPSPPAGHVLVAIHVSGVNFIDVYFRTGLYKSDRPVAIGSEAAGVIEQVGAGVTSLGVGDRVAYTMVRGTYAEYAVVPAANIVRVPDGVSLETAAAVLLQGATAHYLTHSTFPLGGAHVCLVHAAAGGAGGLVVQMAKRLGARVIGTVSTEAKAREMVRNLAMSEATFAEIDKALFNPVWQQVRTPAPWDTEDRLMADAARYGQDKGIQVVVKPHGGGSGASDEMSTRPCAPSTAV